VKIKRRKNMDKIILLMKDGSVLMKNSINKYYDKIKYILFEADPTSNTFLLHEPIKYMKNFTKANIYMETQIRQMVNDTEEYQYQESFAYTPMGSVIKTVYSISEFMSYLNSLNRMRFFNTISRSNDCISYELIECSLFKLEIFCNDKKAYSKELNLKNQKGAFDPYTIMNVIEAIYSPIDSIEFIMIDLANRCWSVNNRAHKNDACGILLPYTRTITFLSKSHYDILRTSVKSLYCRTATFDEIEEPIPDEVFDYADWDTELPFQPYNRLHDVWFHELRYILEYIIYLPYLYMTVITVAEINDFGKITKKYHSKSYFEIEEFSIDHSMSDKHIICTDEEPMKLSDLINKIQGGADNVSNTFI